MKKLKKKIVCAFGFLCVCLVSVSSIVYINHKNNEGLDSEFVIDISEKNYRKVYLLDESNMLVPLSIEVSKKEYLVDEIYTVVSNLRDLNVEGFTNVLAEDIKINKIELVDGILNIDFSSEFLTYQKDIEEKIIEALTWSVLEFKEIKGLTISVDGVTLKKMPMNGFELPALLDKNVGINKHNELMNKCEKCDSVVVLYSKEINGNSYYIPVTRSVEENEELMLMEAYKKDVSVYSGFSKVEELVNLEKIEYEDNEMNVLVDESYLIEDNMVSSLVYELLMVNFFYNDIDYMINFLIDGEEVEVNGYNNSKDIAVSDICFNEIKV